MSLWAGLLPFFVCALVWIGLIFLPDDQLPQRRKKPVPSIAQLPNQPTQHPRSKLASLHTGQHSFVEVWQQIKDDLFLIQRFDFKLDQYLRTPISHERQR